MRDRPLDQSLGSHKWKPEQLGPWRLLSEIGRGGFGVVYRGCHAKTGQEAAVKVIRGDVELDPLELKRFEREITLLRRLDHRNVVRVLDAGLMGASPWVALELVEGMPLGKVELTVPDHVRLLARVARAVGAAHRAKVIHRDLKPANVLVEKATGEPKVLDFGLAFDARLDATRLSKTGEIAGTPAYMAPEVIRGKGAPEDPRRDIYALGVMLHECVSGDHPFARKGLSSAQVIESVLKGVPSLGGRRDVDPELARICDRACSNEPTRRQPDGDTFALELETWLVRRASGAARRPRVVLVLVLVLVLGALGALAGLLASAKAPAPPPTPSPPVVRPPPPPPRPAPPPPSPPPPRNAPEDEIAAIEALIGPMFQGHGSFPDIVRRGSALAELYPEDPRVRFFVALRRATNSGFEFEARRDLVRLLRVRPPLPWQDLVPIALFFRTTGFDRAACCVGEEIFPDDETRPLHLANFQFHFHLLADDPVRDAVRAERLADLCLVKKTDADAQEYPEVYLLHLARASALVGQGQNERAADSLEAAARAVGGRGLSDLQREAAGWRKSPPNPELMGSHFVAGFGTTDFLVRLGRDETPGISEPERRGRALAALGEAEARAQRPEHQALARMRAARFLRRSGHAADARRILAAAMELAPEEIDTLSLLERAVARELLVDEPKDAKRALELALHAARSVEGGEDAFDPRTPCEVADAWALVARARLELDDAKGALEAIARAEALAPRDRRELEELAARAREKR